ncbi:MAG TPA: cob(I)yrinic acid a,c-diamide adenosyltransferase [Bdellovibrionota bacterium]|nr:cob(I)yrinic acid a,c-diamide adenosyltransferase [Bdellovibrionota bacterium]
MVKIYTKGGDKGLSGLFTGERVPKFSPYLHAYGTVDELGATLGVVLAHLDDKEISQIIVAIQNDLVQIGSDLATPPGSEKREEKIKRIEPGQTKQLEKWIDSFDAKLPELKNFILSGGSLDASFLHVARTICRRAERHVSEVVTKESANPEVLIYLNRLSDLFFVLARTVNHRKGIAEVVWKG